LEATKFRNAAIYPQHYDAPLKYRSELIAARLDLERSTAKFRYDSQDFCL